jgi:penicillin-binding protein 1A
LTTDGAVRAMVGGGSYGKSQFNRATQALRQPGSAFKPVVYLAALEAGMSPNDRVLDGPLNIKGWRPKNYDGKYRGAMSLRDALAQSINTVAVRVSELVGRGQVVAAAERLGITTRLPSHPSVALGAGEVTLIELAAAYGVFANRGRTVWPFGIVEVHDSTGKLLWRRSGSGTARVVAARDAARITAMLAGVIEAGTGRKARLARPAAGKTGTSQDSRDAWFMGFTADLIAGVWLGNDDGKPMKYVTGGGLPARLWRNFMTDAHRGLPVRALAAE